MISKTCIIGVFLNRHQLNDVVASIHNSLQVVVSKVRVRAHSLELLGHSHVSLVDPHALGGVWVQEWLGVSPFELFLWVPKHGIKEE